MFIGMNATQWGLLGAEFAAGLLIVALLLLIDSRGGSPETEQEYWDRQR